MKPPTDILNQPIQPPGHIRRAFPARTSISPNIPLSLLIYPLLCSLLPNLRGGQAFIVPVIPLPDRVCDLNFGFTADGVGTRGRVRVAVVPRESFAAADVEEFEGAAGAVAGGDVAR